MTVGALDLETGSTKNYTAQRPWDRDSNSGWRYILCNVCYSKILCGVHITNILRNLKSCYREMKEKQRGILEMRVM